MITATPRQAELLRFIQSEAREGRCPTYRAMAAAMGVGDSTTFRMVQCLMERGHISVTRTPLVLINGVRHQFIAFPQSTGAPRIPTAPVSTGADECTRRSRCEGVV